MRFLLFGGSGFLGRHVHRVLAGVGAVVAPDRATLDLTSGPDSIGSVIHAVAPDAVVNCTGVTDGTAAQFTAGNVVAVADLLAAWERHAPGARLVHLGSAAEYGAVQVGRPVTEDTPPNPMSGYGWSKLAGTGLVRSAYDRGLPATVLRVFNPLGPGTPAYLLPGRLVAALRQAAVTGEPATAGSLDGYRDFVDARDVATAVLAAATATSGGILNVAGGKAVALRDFAALAAELAGVAPPTETAPLGSTRSATVSWQQADLTAIRSTVGWAPEISLEKSLVDMGLRISASSVGGGLT